MTPTSTMETLTQRVRAWVFEQALPFWADAGVDPAGHGFVEHLDLDGARANVNYKRLRVQARQIYVFSHASLLGWRDGLEATARAVDFVTKNARLDGGGWARALASDGRILDPEFDLYDQAFMIFALAWWFRVSGDPSAKTLALETLQAAKVRLGIGHGLGYYPFTAHNGELQQNPHMHLLEGSIAWAEFAGEDVFAEEARTLAGLHRSRFFNPATGALTEFFGADWSPAPGVRGRLVEPGHHFEWSWLLHHYGRILGVDEGRQARALFDFAETHGVAPGSGLIYDEVLDDGSVHSRDCRSWPQTEALKAHLARFEFEEIWDESRIAQITGNLLDHYLNRRPAGTWTDHLKADGTPRVDKIPASTLYHVFLAFSELLRVGDLRVGAAA